VTVTKIQGQAFDRMGGSNNLTKLKFHYFNVGSK